MMTLNKCLNLNPNNSFIHKEWQKMCKLILYTCTCNHVNYVHNIPKYLNKCDQSTCWASEIMYKFAWGILHLFMTGGVYFSYQNIHKIKGGHLIFRPS